MKYLLDSSTMVAHLRSPAEQSFLSRRLESLNAGEVVIPAPARAEILAGVYRNKDRVRALARASTLLDAFLTLPFDREASDVFGQAYADLAKRNKLIGPVDLMIASIAVVHRLIVVTGNVEEFGRVQSLVVENWQTG